MSTLEKSTTSFSPAHTLEKTYQFLYGTRENRRLTDMVLALTIISMSALTWLQSLAHGTCGVGTL